MKLSRDWLSDYVDLSDLSDDELGRRFTHIGHAIESVERHGSDTVFDLEITTNRVDAMSHLGMARELAAALGRPSVATDFSPSRDGLKPVPTQGVTIRIEAPEMCSRFSGIVVRNVSVKPSPPEIQRRLEAVGLRPISNLVDATNYVMAALGHPLHAYDLDKLAEHTIIVRRGKAGESIKTLDGETRKIDAETVVIADAKRAIGLGGIMGGFDTEITASTKNVLIECAWFNPSIIRRTARRLGLKTDASYRFERRVDPNDTLAAAAEVARMIGGDAEAPIDVIAQADLAIPEAEEPHGTFVENALGKARHAAQLSGLPALAEDSGICVDALDGAPGVYSARFAGEPKSDQRNNDRLLELLATTERRGAHYYCVAVLLRSAQDPQPVIAEGEWHGEILRAPRGSGGFGYDPLFLVSAIGRTGAELSMQEKNRISHRGQAMERLLERLRARLRHEDSL